MIDFHQLAPEQQVQRLEVLARAALDYYSVSDDAKIELIKHRENAVFEIIDGDTRYALRVHRENYHTDAALKSELEWMTALNDSSFAVGTPRIIPATDGSLMQVVRVDGVTEPRQVDLLAWVDGAPIGTIEEGVEDVAEAVRSYRQVGALVAKMHNFAGQWTLPASFERHSWDEASFLGDEPLWGPYWKLEALTEQQREVLAKAAVKARVDLAEWGKGTDRYGLIHADTLPENFLLDRDGTVRIIDFDDGGFGWHMFEFATAMFFSFGEGYFDDLLNAMIEGYRQHRDISDEQLSKLTLFLFLRGLTYLGWVHTRKDTTTAIEVTSLLIEQVATLAARYLEGIDHYNNIRTN